MDDLNFKPNSHRYKEEQQAKQEKKKIEKVVSGNARLKKKGELSKLKDTFISEDAANIKSYVVLDVLIPAIKKAVSDIVTNGIDMILYGSDGSKRRSGSNRITYTSYYDKRDRDRDRGTSERTRVGYNYDDVLLETRGEAEDVLTRMDELIDTYGQVSVADLYDLVGISGNYTDNNYGWTNIRNAEPVRVRDGYILKLPKVGPLRRD